MPELPEIATSEAEVWAALQLDLEPTDDSPPDMAPADAAYVRNLIVAAEARLRVWTGLVLTEEDEIDPALTQAIIVDVGANYFARLNPIVPEAYFDLIAPFRRFGFGGDSSDEN